MPLSLLFDPDSFYLGALPVVAEVGRTLGVPAIHTRPGGSSRADDDWFPGEPAHARNVPRRGPDWHRARRSSALHGSVSVRGLRADDVGFRGSRVFPCEGREGASDWQRRRVLGRSHRPGDRARHTDRLDYHLIFECLAERTIAIAQQAKGQGRADRVRSMLAERMLAVLPACGRTQDRDHHQHGSREPGRSRASHQRGRSRCRNSRPVDCDSNRRRRARTGQTTQLRDLETGKPIATIENRLISGQRVRIGAEPIVEALAAGADVVITGRAADPYALRRAARSRVRLAAESVVELGRATLVGHLLRMRRADYRRVLCRSGLQGGRRSEPSGVPDCGGARAGTVHHHEGAWFRRLRHHCDVQRSSCSTRSTIHQRILTPDTRADFSRVRITDAGPDPCRRRRSHRLAAP